MQPEEAYAAWQADPTPDNLNAVVRTLDGPINFAVRSVNGLENPQLHHQARLFASEAVQSYQPDKGAKLSSWVGSHLQSLRRFQRERTGPIKVPERAQLDAWHLEKTRRVFLDKHGVEPDTKELADASHLSVKRIEEVMRATRPVVAASSLTDVEQQQADYMDEALEYVYDESDRVNRTILEHLTGYGGKERLQKNEIAERLGISPSQVTRRSEQIGERLRALETDLRNVYT